MHNTFGMHNPISPAAAVAGDCNGYAARAVVVGVATPAPDLFIFTQGDRARHGPGGGLGQ